MTQRGGGTGCSSVIFWYSSSTSSIAGLFFCTQGMSVLSMYFLMSSFVPGPL